MKQTITKTLLFILLCSLSLPLAGQSKRVQYEETLNSLFKRSMGSVISLESERLNDSIFLVVQNFIRSDSVFNYNLQGIRNLGQITSPDSLVKFITWNTRLEGNKLIYNLFIIQRGSQEAQPKVRFFKTNNGVNLTETEILNVSNSWYGALYYDMRPFYVGEKRYYLLLGLDFFSPVISRKIIEIADLDSQEISLGFPFIKSGEITKKRVIFQYSSAVSMTLRFHSKDTIVMDHLSPSDSLLIGDYRFYGPDFSYDAVVFDGKEWKVIEDYDARNRDISNENQKY